MKALVFTIAGFDAFLERIGYPGLFAYLVLLGEVGGGRVRTSGVWTRGIALARLPNMLTAGR
jgi:putative oxidoreductase